MKFSISLKEEKEISRALSTENKFNRIINFTEEKPNIKHKMRLIQSRNKVLLKKRHQTGLETGVPNIYRQRYLEKDVQKNNGRIMKKFRNKKSSPKVSSRGRLLTNSIKRTSKRNKFKRGIYLNPNFVKTLRQGTSYYKPMDTYRPEPNRYTTTPKTDIYSILFSDNEIDDLEDEIEFHAYEKPQVQRLQYWDKPLYQLFGPPYDHYKPNYYEQVPLHKILPPPNDNFFNLENLQLVDRNAITNLINALSNSQLPEKTEDVVSPSLFLRKSAKRKKADAVVSLEPYFDEESEEDIRPSISVKRKLRKKVKSISHLSKLTLMTVLKKKKQSRRGKISPRIRLIINTKRFMSEKGTCDFLKQN